MNQYLEKVASPQVLNYAWHHLRQPEGQWCHNVSMPDMQSNLIRHIGELSEQLLASTYRPAPMCCRYVNKGWGKGRVVCLSTVRDQLVQQAVLTVLEPLGEVLFRNGFGVVEQHGPALVLPKVREFVRDGHVWLGMASIQDCLDTIPQSAVLKSLYKLCGDKALVKVVRDTLESWPAEFRPAKNQGLPENLVLTPFLCELHLHRFDAFLQSKRIPFVRVKDELMVFAQQEAVAHKALRLSERALKKLGLASNPDQTQVVLSSSCYKFLGKRLPNAKPRFQLADGLKQLQSYGMSLKTMMVNRPNFLKKRDFADEDFSSTGGLRFDKAVLDKDAA